MVPVAGGGDNRGIVAALLVTAGLAAPRVRLGRDGNLLGRVLLPGVVGACRLLGHLGHQDRVLRVNGTV